MRTHRLALPALLAIAVLLVPVAATATGPDGRPDGARPQPVGDQPETASMDAAGEYDVPPAEGEAPPVEGDQVINDDLIVYGSECVGFDCAMNMAFGADTIVLQENNLRILFNDTSTSASYPTNNWRLMANDNTNGGMSWFGFQDAETNRKVFGVEAGAPASALWVDSGGRVGIGTNNPATEIHIDDSDTPAVRLQQNGNGGFAPQTWDVAGNETNFFIRDVTNGSTLPFRIQPDAPSNTLTLRASGDVGIGTWSPGETLHVYGTDGSTRALVEEASTTAERRTLFRMVNNGPASFVLASDESGNAFSWEFGTRSNQSFVISLTGSGEPEFKILANGNAELAGTLTQNSDRNAKQDIVPVDPAEVLDTLRDLDVSEWSYIDDPGTRHIGPMAQDFSALFDVGASDTGISSIDTCGVALAAVKGLQQELDAANDQIADLRQQIADLQAAVYGN